jgi:hypothetical protein
MRFVCALFFLLHMLSFSHELLSNDDICESYSSSDCLTCLNNQKNCVWCEGEVENKCLPKESLIKKCKSSNYQVEFPDMCPITWPVVPTLLPDWMGQLLPVIGHLPLLDLALPGTHDTLTYNLSLTTSDAGVDDYLLFAEVMHMYTSIIPDEIEDFIRQQAQTQAIRISDQLNNGVRFIDFRQMYEYSDEHPEWFSLHFVQSLNIAKVYFQVQYFHL